MTLSGGLRDALSLAFSTDRKLSFPRNGETEANENDLLAIRFASALGIAPRIAARANRLTSAGPDSDGDTIDLLRTALHRAVGSEMHRDLAVESVILAATRIGAPVALLKGVALRRAGHAAIGSRAIGDLDLLVQAAHCWDLHQELRADGFRSLPVGETEVHLPGLQRQPEGLIEIHKVLLGVRPPSGGGSLGFEELQREHLLTPLEGSSGVWIPEREILSAHAIIHGILAHGKDPSGYPMAVMLADLIDLGFGDSTREPGLLEDTRHWTCSSLQPGEIDSIWLLCRRLRNDGFADQPLLDPTHPEEALLGHLIAGRLDPRYRASLGLRWLQPRLSDQSRLKQFSVTLRKSLLPSPGEIEVSTPAHAEPQPRRRRLIAPFRAVGQLVHAVASYAATRLGGPIHPRLRPPPDP